MRTETIHWKYRRFLLILALKKCRVVHVFIYKFNSTKSVNCKFTRFWSFPSTHRTQPRLYLIEPTNEWALCQVKAGKTKLVGVCTQGAAKLSSASNRQYSIGFQCLQFRSVRGSVRRPSAGFHNPGGARCHCERVIILTTNTADLLSTKTKEDNHINEDAMQRVPFFAGPLQKICLADWLNIERQWKISEYRKPPQYTRWRWVPTDEHGWLSSWRLVIIHCVQ